MDRKWTRSGPEVDQPGLDHFGPLLDRPHFRSTSVHFRNTPRLGAHVSMKRRQPIWKELGRVAVCIVSSTVPRYGCSV